MKFFNTKKPECRDCLNKKKLKYAITINPHSNIECYKLFFCSDKCMNYYIRNNIKDEEYRTEKMKNKEELKNANIN